MRSGSGGFLSLPAAAELRLPPAQLGSVFCLETVLCTLPSPFLFFSGTTSVNLGGMNSRHLLILQLQLTTPDQPEQEHHRSE